MNTFAKIIVILLLSSNFGASPVEDYFAKVGSLSSDLSESNISALSSPHSDAHTDHECGSDFCHRGSCHFGHCAHFNLARSLSFLLDQPLDYPLLSPLYAFGLSFEYQSSRLRPPRMS